jgi:hypothetical protein
MTKASGGVYPSAVARKARGSGTLDGDRCASPTPCALATLEASCLNADRGSVVRAVLHGAQRGEPGRP